MKIKVNGEARTFKQPLTIAEMLVALNINPKSVVVERNLKIIPRPEMTRETIEEGDSIEIIRLVGGG